MPFRYKRPENLKVSPPKTFNHISRYSTYNQITDLDTAKTYFEFPNKFDLSVLGSSYHIVESVEEGRLDMISQIYYGNPQYFWIIAMANNIVDPFTVITGTILKIPNMSEIYFEGGPLVSKT